MARKGITYDQVANAAAEIKARGSEPTISAIRTAIGEGSFTTISQHLAKWRDSAADKVDTKDLPPEVEAKIMEAMMVVWNISNKTAQEDLVAIRQEHKDREDELTEAVNEANAEIARLEEVVENGESKNDAMAAELEKLKSDYTACQAKLEATEKLYQELVSELKQPAGKTPARRQPSKASSARKPAESQPE